MEFIGPEGMKPGMKPGRKQLWSWRQTVPRIPDGRQYESRLGFRPEAAVPEM